MVWHHTCCNVRCNELLKGYLFWWNQVSEVYEWGHLGMENMFLIKFGWKPGVTNCNLAMVCTISADAVQRKDYTMKCELLIGGIRCMHIFVVDCLLLHGGIDLDPQDYVTAATGRNTRGHTWRPIKPRAITRIRRNAFSVRVTNDWNGLPPAVVSAETLNQFKNRLDRHWSQIAYTIPHEDG